MTKLTKKEEGFTQTSPRWNPEAPRGLMEQLEKEMLNDDRKDNKKRNRLYKRVLVGNSIESKLLLTTAVKKEYRTYEISLIEMMEKEYDATSTAERLLIHTIVNAYIRILQYTASHTNSILERTISKEKTTYYSMISRELDRASKQYTSSMSLLIQMKSKPIEVKINANTAFFGNNHLTNNSK